MGIAAGAEAPTRVPPHRRPRGTGASPETPRRTPSHSRQSLTVNSGVHGERNVTYAPNADAHMPTTPLPNSSPRWELRTSPTSPGNARLTRKMSKNSSTIDTHQITVTAAWNSQYAFCVLSPPTNGLNTATTKIDESTVWVSTAATGTLRSLTRPSAAGIRFSRPDTNSS